MVVEDNPTLDPPLLPTPPTAMLLSLKLLMPLLRPRCTSPHVATNRSLKTTARLIHGKFIL